MELANSLGYLVLAKIHGNARKEFMISNVNLWAIFIGLVIGNILFAFLANKWNVVLERSFIQGVTLLVVYIIYKMNN